MSAARGASATLSILCLMALSACLELPAATDDEKGTGGLAVFSTVSRPIGEPLPQAPIAGGDILVVGPQGYCVDGKSLRNRASGGFAVLASCHAMTGGKSGAPVLPAVITITAVPYDPAHGVPDADALASAFAPATMISGGTRDGITMVRLNGGGDSKIAEADPVHWRAAMRLGDYLVLLAAYGPEDGAASRSTGGALLRELAGNLRNGKTDTDESGAETEEVATTNPGGANAAPGGIGALLGGLFQ